MNDNITISLHRGSGKLSKEAGIIQLESGRAWAQSCLSPKPTHRHPESCDIIEVLIACVSKFVLIVVASSMG